MEILVLCHYKASEALDKMRSIKRKYAKYMARDELADISQVITETSRFANAIHKQIEKLQNGSMTHWPINPERTSEPDRQLAYEHFPHAHPRVKVFMDLMAVRAVAVRDRAQARREKSRGFFRVLRMIRL